MQLQRTAQINRRLHRLSADFISAQWLRLLLDRPARPDQYHEEVGGWASNEEPIPLIDLGDDPGINNQKTPTVLLLTPEVKINTS